MFVSHREYARTAEVSLTIKGDLELSVLKESKQGQASQKPYLTDIQTTIQA